MRASQLTTQTDGAIGYVEYDTPSRQDGLRACSQTKAGTRCTQRRVFQQRRPTPTGFMATVSIDSDRQAGAKSWPITAQLHVRVQIRTIRPRQGA